MVLVEMTENNKKQELLDLTTGNITGNIFRLAWPAVATMFLETAFALADAFWVGKLGAVAMASVISSQFIIWIIYSLMSIISTSAKLNLGLSFQALCIKLTASVSASGAP